MTFPTFGRLSHLYGDRMRRLFAGRIWEMIKIPGLVNNPEFQKAAHSLAGRMVAEVEHANAASWRAAAQKSTRARQIYKALQAELDASGIRPELAAIARRNAQLISSVPRDIAQRITAKSAELYQAGARPEEIERELRRWAPGLAESRIRLIARTEVSRAETDVTRQRSERIGVAWYQWETSEDQRVRPSHRNMNGVLVAWSDPPNPERLINEPSKTAPYAPGSIYNCRCVSLPLVDVNEVRWPARVFYGGRIVRMTRPEFTKIVGIPMAA
jgi:SPP1 gp7 family putative phage head morphogenesis protein